MEGVCEAQDCGADTWGTDQYAAPGTAQTAVRGHGWKPPNLQKHETPMILETGEGNAASW